VRDDQTSAELLEKIGVDRSKVRHTGDDALLFESDASPPGLPPTDDDTVTIGLNLRDSSTYQKGFAKAQPERFAKILDAVADSHPVSFVFVPISYDAQDDDRVAANAVVESMQNSHATTVITEEHDAAVIRDLCGQIDVGIGISYHFLLFCLSADNPALLLHSNPYYAHKSLGLSRIYSAGEWVVDLANKEDAEIERAIGQLIADSAAGRAKLSAANKVLRDRAEAARREISESLLRDAI